MVKNSRRLGLVLLLCLSLTNFTNSQALAENTLNQVDVKRSNSDGLEFTLYTSSPYADNVVVTKKSDNKYVILMPNVNNAQAAKPDFSSLKDVISDVDVRAVNDGQGGYTKVTVITNHPVDIKTTTAKTAPVTPEQKEYRALIAQQKSKPSAPPSIQVQEKSASNGFKLPEIQPTKTAADIANAKDAVEKIIPNISAGVEKIAQKPTSNTKPAVNKKANKIEKEQNKALSKIVPVSVKKQEVANTIKPVELNKKPAVETVANEKKVESKQPKPETIQKQTSPKVETNKINKEVKPAITKDTDLQDLKNKVISKLPKSLPLPVLLVLIPIISIIALFNLIRASLKTSQLMKKSFLDHIASRKNRSDIKNYDNIINNQDLTWQEKYQQYVDVSGDRPEEKKPAPKYNFVQTATAPESIKAEFIEPEESTTEKLDRILQSSPDVEKTIIEDDINEIEDNLAISENLSDETEAIHKSIKKSFNLKAFAEKTALEETHRNRKIKHRRVHLELPKEMPHINLGYSSLHTNPRSFKNATLSVSDLIAKNNKLLNIKPEFKEDKNDYEMISIDEYFNIISDEKSKITSSLSNSVADSLSQKDMPAQPSKPKTQKKISNPITQKKENPLSGLIIKSKFDIDKNRGFYLVSLDGKSAVIGRIKDEIFVLKKFNRNITKPLQVRQDNSNVYMIKAEEFKSLVEVNNDKMGVLIEL